MQVTSISRPQLISRVTAFAQKEADSPYSGDRHRAEVFLEQCPHFRGHDCDAMRQSALSLAAQSNRDANKLALLGGATAMMTVALSHSLGASSPMAGIATLALGGAGSLAFLDAAHKSRERKSIAQDFSQEITGWERHIKGEESASGS